MSHSPEDKVKMQDYRLRFTLTIFKSIVLPQVLLSLFLSSKLSFSPSLSSFQKLACHILFIPTYASLKSQWNHSQKRRQARALGADMIPCIKGKWPGNLDILLSILKASKEGYVAMRFLELFEEYGCKTLNTRILWEDQVCLFHRSSGDAF